MKDKSWKRFCKIMPQSHSFHGFLQVFGNLPCSYLHFSFWAEGPIDSPWQYLESVNVLEIQYNTSERTMTKYIWICKQSWVYEGKTWWKREEVEHVPCTPVLWLFYLNGRAGIYMYLQQKKPHQALQMECLPFVFEKTWQTKSSKSYCNIFAMNHWCFKSDCGQNLWKIIFVLQHFFDQKHGEQTNF